MYASLIGFHPRRLKASTGDEIPRNGPMRNLLLLLLVPSRSNTGLERRHPMVVKGGLVIRVYVCVVSICAGICAVPRRQRVIPVDHCIHSREIYRNLSSDARSNHVHRQPRQAHYHRALDVRRRLLRSLAGSHRNQVADTTVSYTAL